MKSARLGEALSRTRASAAAQEVGAYRIREAPFPSMSRTTGASGRGGNHFRPPNPPGIASPARAFAGEGGTEERTSLALFRRVGDRIWQKPLICQRRVSGKRSAARRRSG